MKTFYSFLALSFCSALLTCGDDVEKNHLKLYASFDNSARPEIAQDGSGLRSAGKLYFTEGKSGKGVRFSRKSDVGDLLYNLGSTMNGREWSVAMWVYPEEEREKNAKAPGRNLFRTNLGWETGNVFAGFDNWGRFILNHFDAEKKYRGAAISASAIPFREWTHLLFGYREGKHVIYLNGIEASYTRNNDVRKPGPNQTVLRIGSMDFRSRDLFGFLLAAGITACFAIQVIVNALVVSGAIPPTGLPLPLVSAGNTSLVFTMAAMGVLWNVSRGGASLPRSGRVR